MPTIQAILAALQADVANLATYVAGLAPSTVPQNIAAALAALSTAQTQLTTDIAANPMTVGTPVASVILSDVSTLLTAVQGLASAVAAPSNP